MGLTPPYQYRALVLRVVDGDTLDLQIDLGLYLTAAVRVRLLGLNAPEMRGPSSDRGRAAAEYLASLVAEYGPTLLVQTFKSDSFGRWLVRLRALAPDGQPVELGQLLMDAGHAVPYDP